MNSEPVMIWIDDCSTIPEHAWRGLRSVIQEVIPGAVITAEPPKEVLLGSEALNRILARGFEDALATFKPVEMSSAASEKYHQSLDEPWRRQGKRKGRRR